MGDLINTILFVLSLAILLYILKKLYQHLTSDRMRKYRLYRIHEIKQKKKNEQRKKRKS